MTHKVNISDSVPAWKKFQNDVANLFRLSGYDVKQDFLCAFKKVDLIITEYRLGKQHRIAVECKDWEKNLSQHDISVISANYQPLVPKHVDEILIISREPLTETALAMVEASQNLRHLTYTELHANIMDFRQYLGYLVSQYYSDGLDRYYIPPETSESEDLGDIIEKWLFDMSSTSEPIAILGSYGLGKSTFARHIAWKYASVAQTDPTKRIPVLVRLGDISNEQSLEGLFGKLFTATNFVRSYNFHTFEELNKLGRFLFIFDGFDEMKQMLSWTMFKHNLREMNRLVQGKSKVLILGRPTAFLNEAEQKYALHGEKKLAYRYARDVDWPDYKEINLATFTKKQIETFLPAYLKYLVDAAKNPEQKEELEKWINCDLKKIFGESEIWDLIKRPVQLKMITEIIPDFRGDIIKLNNVHSLYDYFIDYVIDRESKKNARLAFDSETRRKFACDVAFWLWSVKRERGITADVIPNELIQPYCDSNEDFDETTRDLISACMLDRQGDRLFFPHRSIQEYLVAQAIFQRILGNTLPMTDLSDALSAQVTEFLEGFVNEKFMKAIARQLSAYRGSLPWGFLKLLSSGYRYRHFEQNTPWGNMLRAVAVREDGVGLDELIQSGQSILNTTRNSHVALSVVFASFVAVSERDSVASQRASRIIGDVLEGLCRILVKIEKLETPKFSQKPEFSQKPVREIIKNMRYSHRRSGEIDISQVYPILIAEIKGYCFVTDWVTLTENGHNCKNVGLPSHMQEWRDGALQALKDSL